MSVAELREKIVLEQYLPKVEIWFVRRQRARAAFTMSLLAVVPVVVLFIRWNLGTIAMLLGVVLCLAAAAACLFIYALSDRMVEAEIEVLRMKFEPHA